VKRLPDNVYRYGKGYRVCIDHNGDSYMSPTYGTILEAYQAAIDLRAKLSKWGEL
jgi:hypothetical protein